MKTRNLSDRDSRRAPPEQKEALRSRLRKHYSEAAAERILRPTNMRPLERPDGYARAEKEDGDRLEFFLRLEDNRIAESAFTAQACAASVACAQAVDLFRSALSDALQMRKDSWKLAFRKI